MHNVCSHTHARTHTMLRIVNKEHGCETKNVRRPLYAYAKPKIYYETVFFWLKNLSSMGIAVAHQLKTFKKNVITFFASVEMPINGVLIK